MGAKRGKIFTPPTEWADQLERPFCYLRMRDTATHSHTHTHAHTRVCVCASFAQICSELLYFKGETKPALQETRRWQKEANLSTKCCVALGEISESSVSKNAFICFV